MSFSFALQFLEEQAHQQGQSSAYPRFLNGLVLPALSPINRAVFAVIDLVLRFHKRTYNGPPIVTKEGWTDYIHAEISSKALRLLIADMVRNPPCK